jgi:metal-responsive CopG/Arc/MetJ family transcriptional regulator
VPDSKRRPYTLYLDPDLLDELERLKERVGVPVSESIRRAIRAWLDGMNQERKPTGTRKAAKRR